jgi:hypothetical protein
MRFGSVSKSKRDPGALLPDNDCSGDASADPAVSAVAMVMPA